MGKGDLGGERSQEIRFCTAPDGVRIAWARHGAGPPLVISTCWLSHLQHDWESPVWRHFLDDLGRVATVIRYDERGHGLSDRDVDDHELAARVGDLEAVIAAAGHESFALMAMSQGGPVAIDYAARHAERVTRLIFYGSYATADLDADPEQLEMNAAFEQMIKVGWARPQSEFRRVFTSMMIPSGGEEQMRWLDELQRVSVTADIAIRARQQRKEASSVHLLPELRMPTLVLHSRHDRMNPLADGRFLASSISGARFVVLESDNHIVLGDEPAWQVFVHEVTEFMQPDSEAAATSERVDVAALLSPRELDVLRLAAAGRTNDEIAELLVLSVRTVERHMQNIYVKLDVQGTAARAAAVAKLLS
jgi:pimeloyl-ACP methyl ester carboxylesterase/DNA-binding CsgD family transcriptional regulator